MKYNNILHGQFLARPNRFIAQVLIKGAPENVHVKNTGRCKEILTEGTKVILEKSHNPNRKTAYSLIAVYKGNMLINIDSQIPNAVVHEGIVAKKIPELANILKLQREVFYGNSRFDIYFETPLEKGFVEVKGVTLEEDGIVMFPDAPTERGTKHLREMIKAVQEGYKGYIIFLIQMKGVKYFTPNAKTDIEFSRTLKLARDNGVNILAFDSLVMEDEIIMDQEVEVIIPD